MKAMLIDIAITAGIAVVAVAVANRLPYIGPVMRNEQKLFGVL